MKVLDIVTLIEKNPITRLRDTYNNKLVEKYKNTRDNRTCNERKN